MSSSAGPSPSVYQSVQSSEKIEVPLPSGISVYAQFKYVRGVPANSSQEALSINKAQVIDNMVSYLNNNPDEYSLDKKEEFNIGELEKEIYKVVNDQKPNFNALPGKGADTGIIFDLTA